MTDKPDSPEDEARTPSVPREKLLAMVDPIAKMPAEDLEKLSDAFLAGMVIAAMDVAATEYRLTHDGITTIDDVNGYAETLMGMTSHLSPALGSHIIGQVTLHSIARRNSIVQQAMRPTTPQEERHNFGEALLNLIGLGLMQAGMSAELLVTEDPAARYDWLSQVAATSEATGHSALALRAMLSAPHPPQRIRAGGAFFRADSGAESAPCAEA